MITWTSLVSLLHEHRGRMPEAKWFAIRDEIFTRKAQGQWDADYSDLVDALLGG